MPRLPPSHAPGLETRLLKAWPWFLLAGTVFPLLVATLIGVLAPDVPTIDEQKRLWQAWFALAGLVVFYWTMVATLGIGCLIVRVMKGPVREGGDPYPLPVPDRFEA